MIQRFVMHLIPLIQDLAVILAAAGLVSLLFQKIKQPIVLGYILAGLLVGPHTPPHPWVSDLPSIQTWGELGVIFLMFSLGLEFSFRKLARVGVSAGISAGFEVLFMIPIGYFVSKAFGWSSMDSLFVGAMLAISSTTIIIKALDELKLKTRRFAQMIFAILIVEDLVAILLLVALTTIATEHSFSGMNLVDAAWKLILVVSGWFLTGYFLIPRFIRYVGKTANPEILTIVSVGLCLALVVFAGHFQYSAALGAFIMGSILAETKEIHHIEARIAPIRDVFAAVFFVSVGMLIDPKILWEYRSAVLILSAVTIAGKIISISIGSLISGNNLKDSVQVGFGLAQIGEFSFIIAGLGLSLKITSDFIYPVGVAVSLVTTFTTPYLMRLSEPVSQKIETWLPEGWVKFIHRYQTKLSEKRLSSAGSSDFRNRFTKWVINGLAVSVIFVAGGQMMREVLDSKPLAWTSVMILSSPFLWGMFNSFREKPSELTPSRNPRLFFFRLLTIIWILAVSAPYFPARYFLALVMALLILFIGLFRQQLSGSYAWFEDQFLATFDEKKKEPFQNLAPWDAHLIKIQVHPNSVMVGKRLMDTDLRQKHGVNIIVIQRGQENHVAPKPDAQLLPNDELLILGTDAELEAVRGQFEDALIHHEHDLALSEFEMRAFYLGEKSLFVGKSIRQSSIRETYHSIVVGIEHGGKRKLSPDSDLKLQVGDLLWIVGSKANLVKLQHVNGGFDPTEV